MKTTLSVTIPIELAIKLKQSAEETRGTQSGIVARALASFLNVSISDEQAQRGAGLTKHEKTTLNAFQPLLDNPEGAWRFDHFEIAAAAGLTPKQAYFALRRLQDRGLVTGFQEETTDAWGRPTKSYWRLMTSGPQAPKASPTVG